MYICRARMSIHNHKKSALRLGSTYWRKFGCLEFEYIPLHRHNENCLVYWHTYSCNHHYWLDIHQYLKGIKRRKLTSWKLGALPKVVSHYNALPNREKLKTYKAFSYSNGFHIQELWLVIVRSSPSWLVHARAEPIILFLPVHVSSSKANM